MSSYRDSRFESISVARRFNMVLKQWTSKQPPTEPNFDVMRWRALENVSTDCELIRRLEACADLIARWWSLECNNFHLFIDIIQDVCRILIITIICCQPRRPLMREELRLIETIVKAINVSLDSSNLHHIAAIENKVIRQKYSLSLELSRQHRIITATIGHIDAFIQSRRRLPNQDCHLASNHNAYSCANVQIALDLWSHTNPGLHESTFTLFRGILPSFQYLKSLTEELERRKIFFLK